MGARNGQNGATRRARVRPLRVAVIGLGYWGPNLVRNLLELEGVQVACVCDLQTAAREKMCRRYPAILGRKSVAAVLADKNIDAVIIATPVGTHHAIAAAALAAGKHVFVEKPLAASSMECLDLIALARRQELTLMAGHTFLYSPPVNMIRDLIVSGEVGEVYFISMNRVNLGIHQPDVSVVWDLGPHDFSILLYWLQENPTHVTAISRGCIMPDKPDVAFINLEFESGVITQVQLSWLAPSKLRRTTVVGSRQMIVYDDTSLEPVRIFDAGVSSSEPATFGEYQLSYRTGTISSPRVDIAEPLLLEMEDFCSSIRSQGTPRASAEIGLEVVQVIEAVDRSLALGGERVAVNSLQTASVG